MDKNELKALASAYVENKRELDSYKKLCDEEGSQIKQGMLEQGLDEIPVNDEKALRKIVAVKYDVDEVKLLSVIKKYNIPAVKTVEVVDESALENFLYGLDDEKDKEVLGELDGCKTIKTVVSLKLVNNKSKED